MKSAQQFRRRGFTLLESVVALAVFSVGLLGAAGMLLDSLRIHAGALRRLAATQLVRDMADRIRANAEGRERYDTRTAAASPADCAEHDGCDVAQIATADRSRFAAAAAALFTPHEFSATVEFVPATGPAVPERYVIVLQWRDSRDAAGDGESVALQVAAQPPVAG